MYSDTTYDRIFDWLGLALEAQEIENFKPAYDGLKCLTLFFFIETEQNVSCEQFVLDVVVRIYDKDGDEDEDYLNPICPPFNLAKLIHIDNDLKIYVESILNSGVNPCGHPVSPKKLLYLNEALQHAKNFHPNYLPEHLLEC